MAARSIWNHSHPHGIPTASYAIEDMRKDNVEAAWQPDPMATDGMGLFLWAGLGQGQIFRRKKWCGMMK